MEHLEKWQKSEFEEHRDGWSQDWKSWKIGEFPNSRDQDQEKLCKSIIKGGARRNREKNAILAEVGEEDQRASCPLVTSPAKNCRGTKCAKLVNIN